VGTNDQIEVMLAIEFFYNIRAWNTQAAQIIQGEMETKNCDKKNPPKVNDTPRSLSAHPLHTHSRRK
jgi:hypothetical protein